MYQREIITPPCKPGSNDRMGENQTIFNVKSMKLYHSLPKASDILKHDGPLLQVVSVGVIAFVLLSSITNFAGLALHFELKGNLLWLYGTVIYPLFALTPDLINLVCLTWVVRTLLKWRKLEQDVITTAILIVCCLALSGLCTWYSFNLSQISAVQVADWMKPKQTVNAQLDSTLLQQSSNILALDSVRASGTASAAQAEQQAVVRTYDNQIKALQADSLYWEDYKTEQNFQWVDRRKLDRLKIELRNLRLQRDTSVLALASSLNVSAGTSASLKDTITSLLLVDTKAALERRQEEQARKDGQHSFITMLVSSIAGFAVLILLALGAVREVLFHRNDIEPLPVVGPFDFQNFNHWKEVLFYPFVWAGRHIINKIRTLYAGLPDLEEPVFEGFAFDHDVKMEIVKLKPRTRKASQEQGRPGIGFKIMASQSQDKEAQTNIKGSVTNATVSGLPPKACLHCENDFSPKVAWQKFCREDCRMEHHAQKHDGERFNARKFHKKK